MTERNFDKAMSIRGQIFKMECTLKTINGNNRIYASTSGLKGNMDTDLSNDKEVDKVIRNGMIAALERRIEELKAEFKSL